MRIFASKLPVDYHPVKWLEGFNTIMEQQQTKNRDSLINHKVTDGAFEKKNIPTDADKTFTLIQRDVFNANNDSNDSVETQALLEFNSRNPIEKLQTELNNDWITGIIFFGFILLAIIKVNFLKRFNQFGKGFVQQRFMNHLTREGNIFNERISLGLFVVYIIGMSLFLLLLNRYILHFQLNAKEGIYMLWKIMYVLLIYVSGKMLLMKLVGFVFRTGRTTNVYLTDMLLYNLMVGVALLPILLVIHTTSAKMILMLGGGILVITYIWRILRGIKIGLGEPRFSLFYFILYLCTLEIFPALLIYKLASQSVI